MAFFNLRWQDFLDILIVAFLIYRILLLLVGTRAMQLIRGLLIIGLIGAAANLLDLRSLSNIMGRMIGALIIIERNVPLGDTTERGVVLDALISKELLINVFWPNSPLHDGAAIIRRNRLLAAGCILPLSTAVAKRDYGTRHRAALGISEESDAAVVVVSEERGVVAIAVGGKLTGALDEAKLPRVLASILEKKI